MSKRNIPQPSRPLSVNFTDRTLKRAITQKRQADRLAKLQGVFFMKKQFWKQPVGALAAIALVVMGGAGVYAATSWFGGSVKVTSDNSIMTVDLSQCESNIPPGVGPKSDRSNIQFKITGSPHISTEELQRKLLVNCEFDSVLKFYQTKFGAAIGTPSAVIKNIDKATSAITFELKWGREDYVKTFTLAADSIVMDKGEPADITALKQGDHVMFAYKLPDSTVMSELDDPFNHVEEVVGVFKTQYDTREFLEDAKSLYSANNIMPLDLYNDLQKQ